MEVYQNIDRETLLNLKRGDVIRYRSEILGDNIYLIVSEIDAKEGKIRGTLASAKGVNHIPIDELLLKEELKIFQG